MQKRFTCANSNDFLAIDILNGEKAARAQLAKFVPKLLRILIEVLCNGVGLQRGKEWNEGRNIGRK
jgi:hypothetical protein